MTHILTPHFNVGLERNMPRQNAVRHGTQRGCTCYVPRASGTHTRCGGSSLPPRFENRGYDVGRAWRHWFSHIIVFLLR
jgi:hypothetical protein